MVQPPEDYRWCHKRSAKCAGAPERDNLPPFGKMELDSWKKGQASWNLSDGWDLNRRMFGERKTFPKEATVGKEDPRSGK